MTATNPATSTTLPDHTQLPESDGTFVKNFQEHPQSILITESIKPVLQKRHPDGQYCIGQDSGIYWRITDPPERGAEAPDWFYVPNVPPTLNGQMRRSYVLWQEHIAPLIVLEFVSGDGSEERDKTPWKGKFWIYEQVIHPAFYGIYEVNKASVEMYHIIESQYQLLPANERGHYPIAPLGVELGIWQGVYQNAELPWLRWWDLQGNLLLSGDERAEQESQRAELESQRAELESQRAELERQRADRLTAQLRSLGIEPEV
ncbi:transcriptional regulator [Nostoc sp. 'Peltigera membranacea cyanobiont' 213]|uniref:Uma2 family endonuclease n=1 Tax=unclassified Nostoc TaxID=2593658 RepID=UPI000B9508F2|nr:Uma2 family endonuclease [Nostoc sp. 'Peltigera membranacea cyanobiont' 213]OYD99236.1 transcriptional regulator [Nostoc sp. 'Peltigera membranacea cyanobiont' 213]